MSTIQANAILDASGGNTTTINGVTPNTGSVKGRNIIINGAMELDQRNSGSSVTPANAEYVIDRWRHLLTASSKYTVQQVADAPSGFKNSAKFTSSSAYTVPSSEVYGFEQRVEGNNIIHLGWGTSSAKTATLSFWVKSSLTGTLSGVVTNNSTSFPFDYTINTANTWEKKTVTITGDTAGTWGNTEAAALYLRFMIGIDSGGQWAGVSGSWTGTNEFGSTSHDTNIVGTSGATWQITGIQLEEGTVATEFDRRSYGEEIALCQRYFQKGAFARRWTSTGSNEYNFFTHYYVTQMRAAPTRTFSGGSFSNIIGSAENTSAEIATGIACQISYRANATGTDTYVFGRDVEFDAEL